MLIKILQAGDERTIETAYNEFQRNHTVSFVQSHVAVDGTNIFFTLFIYYADKAPFHLNESTIKASERIQREEQEKEKLTAKQKQDKVTEEQHFKRGWTGMYKPCPKCQDMIPDVWLKHFKCGWVQE